MQTQRHMNRGTDPSHAPLHLPRNAGTPLPLDLSWVRAVQAIPRPNRNGGAGTLPGRRSVKKEWQAALALQAISS